MKYQVGPTCYSSADAAISAIAAQQLGAVVTHGGAAYVLTAAVASPSGTPAAVSYTLTPVAGGPAINTVQFIELPTCSQLDWADAAEMTSPVAVIWIVAAAISGLRRALHNDA